MTTTTAYGDPRLPSRFWAQVKKQTNGCWHWTGTIHRKTGYGQYAVGSATNGTKTTVNAHRHIYEELVAKLIPRGEEGHMQVDHECHNRSKSCQGGPSCLHRRCVNPAHLYARDAKSNSGRSKHAAASKNRAMTHCAAGHLLAGENLGWTSAGKRYCRPCHIRRTTENNRKRREAERPEDWAKVEWNSLKTHCPQGHPYEGDNLKITKNGRACRQCMYEASRRHAEKKRTGEVPAGNRADWTHCKHGHELAGENLIVDPKSRKRKCRTCVRARQQAATEARRAAKAAARDKGGA